MIDGLNKEQPLESPPSMAPTFALRTILMIFALVFIFILAAIVAFVRGNPAPSFPPLHQTSVLVSPSP